MDRGEGTKNADENRTFNAALSDRQAAGWPDLPSQPTRCQRRTSTVAGHSPIETFFSQSHRTMSFELEFQLEQIECSTCATLLHFQTYNVATYVLSAEGRKEGRDMIMGAVRSWDDRGVI